MVVADIKSSLLDNMFNINSMNGYTIYVADTETGEVIYEPDDSAASPISKAISGKKDTEGLYVF